MVSKEFGGFEDSWLTGQILIAMPAMTDPRFSQSVIFLCAHTPDGAMGIVLNQPLDKPRFG
jgi:putative transcriptional regulator